MKLMLSSIGGIIAYSILCIIIFLLLEKALITFVKQIKRKKDRCPHH
jgi:hypothetical protein